MEVFITSEEEKLPEEVRVLTDETRPLLPGITFFEQHYTVATLVGRLAGGAAMLLGGALVMIFGVLSLVEDLRRPTVYSNQSSSTWWILGFGAVLGFVGWMFVSSLRDGWAINRRQNAGGHTRHGIYLLPHALVSRSSFDTTIIPRTCFRGLEGNSVRYEFKGEVKSFGLPSDLVGASMAQLQTAILVWSQLPDAK